MWPFTSRRILGNRWWALAFVVFVCWQAIEIADSTPVAQNGADNASATDMTGAPIDEDQLRNSIDALQSMK